MSRHPCRDVDVRSLHQTALDQTFSFDDFDSAHLLDVWFECRQPEFTSIGLIFQLDFDTKIVDWDSSRVPQRTDPMTSEERYEYAQAVQDGDVPAWTTP